MRMSYMILQRRVGTLREEMKAILALSFFLTVGHNAHVEVFPNLGVRLVGMISTNCMALVEPTPVVVEADSLAIEAKIKEKAGIQTTNWEWDEIVEEMTIMYCGNSIDSIIRRISFAAGVYLIWQERNWRIFRDERRKPAELFRIFEDLVRMRLLSLKVKKSIIVGRAQQRWNINFLQTSMV
ncbi:hypothetical protein Tco_1212211 [Tanacetum coccineum]